MMYEHDDMKSNDIDIHGIFPIDSMFIQFLINPAVMHHNNIYVFLFLTRRIRKKKKKKF